jgi:two-component system response regulator AtoC
MSTIRQELRPALVPTSIVGTSVEAQKIRDFIVKVGPSRHTVFLIGETGTGKDYAAEAIHRHRSHGHGQFVPVNCSAIPEQLFESEFFGHNRGAFTGAQEHKTGLFQVAESGTIFLNEIAEISPAMQAKLLGALEGRSCRRVGETREFEIKTRIIAATNADPETAIAQGKLRADLYYRLSVFQLEMAPLRERREDIPALVEHFLRKEGSEKRFTPEALEAMKYYDWPGNIRELENVVIRAANLSVGEEGIGVQDVAPHLKEATAPGNSALQRGSEGPSAFTKREVEYLKDLLKKTKGNLPEAAEIARVKHRSMRHLVKKYKLNAFVASLREC